MLETSARLLGLLQARSDWTGPVLAKRLGAGAALLLDDAAMEPRHERRRAAPPTR